MGLSGRRIQCPFQSNEIGIPNLDVLNGIDVCAGMVVKTLESPIFDEGVFQFGPGYSIFNEVQQFLLPYKCNGIPNRNKGISSSISHSVVKQAPFGI